MAGITQLVDERIEAIRKERAELAAMRESLERQQAALDNGEVADTSDDELSLARSELARIREEKAEQLMRFGAEMDKLRDEKTAEAEKRVQELNGEVAFLMKGRKELEDELSELRATIAAARDDFENELTAAFTAAATKAREKAATRVFAPKKKQPDALEIADELEKVKLARIAEIEDFLVSYREKRTIAIDKEIIAKAKQKLKARAELAQ
jgi:hypothetical protein